MWREFIEVIDHKEFYIACTIKKHKFKNKILINKYVERKYTTQGYSDIVPDRHFKKYGLDKLINTYINDFLDNRGWKI